MSLPKVSCVGRVDKNGTPHGVNEIVSSDLSNFPPLLPLICHVPSHVTSLCSLIRPLCKSLCRWREEIAAVRDSSVVGWRGVEGFPPSDHSVLSYPKPAELLQSTTGDEGS